MLHDCSTRVEYNPVKQAEILPDRWPPMKADARRDDFCSTYHILILWGRLVTCGGLVIRLSKFSIYLEQAD